jgi:oxygen-dependent protoporphyrinogen oxidase
VAPDSNVSSATSAVVIGAGLSGLAAAWRLRERGCSVVVLERRARCGGRVGGGRIEGFGVEGSMQVLRSNDRHLTGFIRDAGLSDELLPLRPVATSQLSNGKVEPVASHAPLDIARIPGVRFREGLRTLRLPRLMRRYRSTLDRDYPERAGDWDFRSVGDFARLYFGKSVFERFASPIATSSTFGNPDELSRVAFLLEWIAEENGRFGVARRGLSELPAHVASLLGVRTEISAKSVVADGNGYAVACSDGSTINADIVVVATSAPEAHSLCESELVPAERDYLTQLETGAEAVLVAAMHRAATGTPQYVRVPASEGEIVESLLVEPGVADGRAPVGGGLATVTGNYAFCESSKGASDEVVEKELAAALERIYPSVVGTIEFTLVYRRKASLPRFDVGAYRNMERFRRVLADRRSLGRRLYFAGDYLSGLSADQTVGSGFRAAEEALADLSA